MSNKLIVPNPALMENSATDMTCPSATPPPVAPPPSRTSFLLLSPTDARKKAIITLRTLITCRIRAAFLGDRRVTNLSRYSVKSVCRSLVVGCDKTALWTPLMESIRLCASSMMTTLPSSDTPSASRVPWCARSLRQA